MADASRQVERRLEEERRDFIKFSKTLEAGSYFVGSNNWGSGVVKDDENWSKAVHKYSIYGLGKICSKGKGHGEGVLNIRIADVYDFGPSYGKRKARLVDVGLAEEFWVIGTIQFIETW